MPPSAPGRGGRECGQGRWGWGRLVGGGGVGHPQPLWPQVIGPSLLWALAVMMAMEGKSTNASTLLPGLRLGYDLFDTCSNP